MKAILKDSLYFGIDEFEIYVKKEQINFFDDLVYSLDYDNTPSAYIELSGVNFHYSKFLPEGYDYGFKFNFIFENTILDGFSINFKDFSDKDEKGNLFSNTKIVLVLYASFLTIYNYGKFDLVSFLKENFNFEKNKSYQYRRLDFACDVPYLKPEIIKYFEHINSTINKDKKTGISQTYYTREIKNKLNRLMTTRIYDKKADTFRKKKAFLYTHLDNENVNRIEVEIRPDYAKTIGYYIYDILINKEVQKNIFVKFLNKDLKKKFKLKVDDLNFGTLQTRGFDLSTNFQKLSFIPQKYMAQANGYCKNIIEQTGYKGFCQFVFGNFFDDDKKQVRLPSGKINYTCYRKPELLIPALIEYLIYSLGLSQEKINKLLKPYIKTPKIKLNP